MEHQSIDSMVLQGRESSRWVHPSCEAAPNVHLNLRLVTPGTKWKQSFFFCFFFFKCSIHKISPFIVNHRICGYFLHYLGLILYLIFSINSCGAQWDKWVDFYNYTPAVCIISNPLCSTMRPGQTAAGRKEQQETAALAGGSSSWQQHLVEDENSKLSIGTSTWLFTRRQNYFIIKIRLTWRKTVISCIREVKQKRITLRDGERSLIAVESGTDTMAAIKINNNYAAEGNVLLLTSWWEEDLDAGTHNNAEWDKFFWSRGRTDIAVSHKTDHRTLPPDLTCPHRLLARHQQTLEIRLIEFGSERLAHMPCANYTDIKNVCTSKHSKSCHNALSWFFCILTVRQCAAVIKPVTSFCE